MKFARCTEPPDDAWQKFEEVAKEHFKRVGTCIEKRKKYLQRKLDELDKFEV